MSGLFHEIQRISCDLASDKPTVRNKAVELLDQKLNNFGDALHAILVSNQELSWTSLFNDVIQAIIKHASNLQAARDKTHKSLADKCYLYGNVMDKIIDYNLENGKGKAGHFLTKSTIFEVFEKGIQQRIILKHFGDHFLNLVDRGIFLSPSYINNLKVSEYSRLLSYLFELNIENDEFLHSKILKCITKTVQLASERVQLHPDLADYLPTLSSYTQDEKNSSNRIELVRLYHLFLSELSVNYHHKLCIHMQEILPKLCDYHNCDTFRDDTKNILFECIILSLHAFYPKLNNQDFNTFQVPIQESWPQTMYKLKTIVDIEIRKVSVGRNRKLMQLISAELPENFYKMSALIMYIVLWHIEISNTSVEAEDVPSKRIRIDQMEGVIKLIDKNETSFNDIWFTIFAELLQLSNSIINTANYQQILQTTLDVLLIYGNGKNLKNVRVCIKSLLRREQELLKTASIPVDYLDGHWSQIATHLLSDSRPCADVIVEKQIIFQALIKHNKLNASNCATLLQSIQSNELLRRNECINTIREIFRHADRCGVNKASAELEPIVNWAYTSRKRNATQIIHNIADIDVKLLADTFAIGIINFLDDQQLPPLASISSESPTAIDLNLELLNYKYNKQLVCLNETFQSKLFRNDQKSNATNVETKNCLFQNNYELLMRLLNLPTNNDHTDVAITNNLRGLYHLICTMERLLYYKVFDAENLMSCPLIKRIGLFLSQIEFQYKESQQLLHKLHLSVILKLQIDILDVFNSNEILLQYLEKQPIEMLLEFIGAVLKHNSTRTDPIESADRATILKYSLHILGRLCANSSYSEDAFDLIKKNVKQGHHQPEEVLLVTKMLCSCKSLTSDSIEWLVDKLKDIFQHLYTNVKVISELVEHIPSIFYFAYNIEHLLDDMMMALNTLLRLALKKSYPTQLAVKIVNCVADIVPRCPNIFQLDNFAVICMSVAKFLSIPTLEVRLATTATLTLLLNINYCVNNSNMDATNKCGQHLEFCQQLYETIEWKKFTYIIGDLEQNSNSVAVQTFVAFFAFSSFHQELALEHLLIYFNKHKLTETNFSAFSTIVPGYKLTMQQLMKPYADSMLNKCKSLHWPMRKFPYYLFYNSKEAFLKDHSKSIAAYTYIYGKPDDIKLCSKYIKDDEYANILNAYLSLRYCEEAQDDEFQQHLQNLEQNLKEFELNPLEVPLNAMTLCYIIRLLLDASELTRLFGSTVHCNKVASWYNIGKGSLFSTLLRRLNGSFSPKDVRFQTMSNLMSEHPLILVDLLTILKTDCHKAVLPSHLLHSLFLFCTIADALLDTAEKLESSFDDKSTTKDINCAYFVQDIWFFITRFLLHTKCGQVQSAALHFLQIMLTKKSFALRDNSTSLDELVKLLMSCTRKMETKQLRKQATVVLKTFSELYSEQLSKQILFEENSESEPLHHLTDAELPNDARLDFKNYISAFLKPNRLDGRLQGLREYIAEHKAELQQDDELLFQLINRLICMVRDSPKEESSMDALKCLAEIGPLKMQNNFYYFQTDFDAFDQSNEEPMDHFICVIMETLDKQLFNFNTSTQHSLIEVIGHVVNSISGSKLHVKFPYFSIFYQKKKSSFLNSFESIPSIDWVNVLKSCDQLDYEQWMCAFMSKVFNACGWQGFDTLALNSFTFANDCLQPIIKLLLSNKDVHLHNLCLMLNHFFARFSQSTRGIYQEKRAIKHFLFMCECIRLTNNWNIPIDLGNAIMASNHCQAYFLSIMYLELWFCKTDGSILDNDNFQKDAKKAYESIGCLDAMSGFLNPLRSRVDYLSLDNNLFGCCLESENMDEPNSDLCISLMKSNGMYSWANLLQKHKPNKEVKYELFWRLGQWDEVVETQPKGLTSKNMEIEFHEQHYLALKSINNREEENTASAIKNAYHCVKGVLRDISIECLQSVYKYMTWLSTLQQVEDFSQIQSSTQLSTTQISEIFNKWQTELNLTYGNFNCKEHILSHQIALFKLAGTRASRRIEQYYKQSPVDTYLLKCISVCKDAGKLNMATNYIATLRGLPNIKEPTKISVLLEDADVHVKAGNYQIAKATLQHVVSNSAFQFCLQRVPALRMQGEFLLNCNAESFSYILEHNFNKSLKLLDQFEIHQETLMTKYPDIFTWSTFDTFVNENRKQAHAAIAKYADQEYQKLHTYRNSQEYKMIADIIQQNRELASSVSQRSEKTDRDRRVGAIHLSRFANQDEAELLQIEDNLTEHLCTAIEHYIAYCQLDGGSSSAEIYRLIALWFTNVENERMLGKITDLIHNVPSYKFICALNQMVSRLTSTNAAFHKVLVEVLVRCGRDHPQQTFYQLYPLVYAHMDGNHSNTQRANIAKNLIAQICKNNPTVADCSKQFNAMFPALIEFANTYIVQEPSGKKVTKGIPEKIRKLNTLKLDMIHCPTMSLMTQSSKNYNIISMEKWKSDFTLCGGLNAPIKMSCLCSDGVVRHQLIKGKDDLRQDAVMQQVFGIVNELLNNDSEFIERKLNLRTYKVTPLSMRSGILEWCSNTIPVATYLVGNNSTSGAHMKYHPKDWTNKKCREMSMNALRKSDSIRKAIYDQICAHVKPVFHHFFLEKFSIPGVWFERRLAYINSVAATSMVGYVLGIGDRHAQNILIDEQTGEVIHIDFGIAFEQGKIQATKETVPFRLSRDFVAPMGFCGTNGVFTKSCEAMMHILRRYKPVLTTILEVLLYDPLFIWGVLSKKDQSQEESSKESKNLLAQRALILVQHKLEGREHGVLDNSSVETQVQRLINEATLPSNLAMLYPGWDPYL